MPKTLYLVRHAKSSWKNPELSDSERPLNKRGKHDAPLIGRFLKQKNEIPELLVSSTAKRALKTAENFAEELHSSKKIVSDESLYMAGIDDFISVIENIEDSINSVMLFSHNPGITDFANYITGSDIENIPTAGTVRIDFSMKSWKDCRKTKGELKFFISPKKL
jgi:phosphohistidine phosphatase